MMIRAKEFRIGSTVRLHDSAKYGAGNAYPLPDGWVDGQTVTVVAFDHGYVTVKDETGKQSEVYITNIDSGWYEHVNGKWHERNVSKP